MNIGISFFNSVNSAVCHPCLIDNKTFNTGNYVRIPSRKSGRNDLLKANVTGVPSSLPLPLFLLMFFLLSSFALHSTIRTPGTG